MKLGRQTGDTASPSGLDFSFDEVEIVVKKNKIKVKRQ